MTVRAVFFDVGETLVDERRYWRQVAELAGVPEHALWAALGVTIEHGEDHTALFRRLGVERPAEIDDVVAYDIADLYPDALACLEAVQAAGYLVGMAGNQSARLEAWARSAGLPVDVIGSSASWGVRKPAPAFFERLVAETGFEPHEVAYVGDRVDNDVVPAAAAGLVAVWLRRGPWGLLQDGSEALAVRIDSLAELPAALPE
ncbi:MAG: HAD family hydrolase [Actinobacteria bacterium]|nr:MAG: HAD family hydrolase [Actinomycetota bacterium]